MELKHEEEKIRVDQEKLRFVGKNEKEIELKKVFIYNSSFRKHVPPCNECICLTYCLTSLLLIHKHLSFKFFLNHKPCSFFPHTLTIPQSCSFNS